MLIVWSRYDNGADRR